MYSEALSQMHLPHSHLPWLLQMPWEGRGDGEHPRAIVDTQRHWESARCQLPVALSFRHWVDLQQPCLVWSSLVQAGQDLPLDCRCRCRCSWDTRSPALPSRSRTHTRPWSSDRDLRHERRNYPGSSAVPPPGPVCSSPAFFGGATGLQTDSAASTLHICKHRVPAAHRQSLNPPCQCHQPRGHPACATRTEQGTAHPTTGGRWGRQGRSHHCRGSRRCVGTAGRRTDRMPRRSAVSGPRSSTDTSRTGTRPGLSRAPHPQGGCRLRCWETMPGSSRTCPLAWWGGDGAERGKSRAQDSRVPGRMPKVQVCVTVGPQTQHKPWEAYGAGQSPYQPGWQMHCPQTKSPWKLHLRELNSCCCKRRETRCCRMGSAAPKTISGIRKADLFCPQDQALP